jgi:pimeloyl-ACP methyl ester carboxylesterase
VDLRPSSRGRSGPAPHRTATVLTSDGERVSAAYDRARDRTGLAIVVAHGFTGSWRRPDNRRVARALSAYGDVVSYDHRGHGSSSGVTTLGDAEVLDLDAAVRWARWCGAERVVTVGFSMGGSVVLRQAALADAGTAPAAVVSVSAAGFWFYKGTPPMRVLHRAVASPLGRGVLRHGFGTAVTAQEWSEPYPLSPSESAGLLAPTPLLVVHGTQDTYFPVEHARSIVTAYAEGARGRGVADRSRDWIVEGFGHAESGVDDAVLAGIGAWAREAAGSQVPA